MPTKTIALEEAFNVRALQGPEDALLGSINPTWGAYLQERIYDLTDLRIAEMDSAGIDVQVLSLTSPGIQGMTDTEAAVATACEANDLLAGVVAEHPDRFAGFAALPCQDPAAAVRELERSVRDLGLRGALINGQTAGVYLDDDAHSGLWEAAASLGVPIYIHPADPPEPFACCEGYPLQGATFGWGFETGTHVLRLILAGVFDRHPSATVVIGHMGELLPFNLVRLDDRYDFYEGAPGIAHPPSWYVRHNVMITTSGVNDEAALQCAIGALGADRIMFAVDYPYQRNEPAVAFLESAAISEVDRELIGHGNAERLLGLG